MNINGKTKLLGIIGNPVEHSKSPGIHNKWMKQYNIDGAYVPFHVKSDLGAFINGLRNMENFHGANVTVPHKVAVMDFLDEIEEGAAKIGAVNTIRRAGDKLSGFNTDYKGFVLPLENMGFSGKQVSVIGAGGAARAVLYAMIEAGSVETINIFNRSLDKARQLAESMRTAGKKIEVFSLADNEAETLLPESDLIIQTTSVGMSPDNDACPVPGRLEFSSGQIVYDLVYNPAKTKLLSLAEKKGATVIGGTGMLLNQAKMAFKIWFDIFPE